MTHRTVERVPQEEKCKNRMILCFFPPTYVNEINELWIQGHRIKTGGKFIHFLKKQTWTFIPHSFTFTGVTEQTGSRSVAVTSESLREKQEEVSGSKNYTCNHLYTYTSTAYPKMWIILHFTQRFEVRGHWGWISGHFMCRLDLLFNRQSAPGIGRVCAHAFPQSWPTVTARFIFPKLHELFHWSGPSLLGNTMATGLAGANVNYHNKHTHTHTHIYVRTHSAAVPGVLRQHWAIDILYPPRPRGLAGQNWAVIEADTQVELYYQPLDTERRNGHKSCKNTARMGRVAKSETGFRGSRNVTASSGPGELAS